MTVRVLEPAELRAAATLFRTALHSTPPLDDAAGAAVGPSFAEGRTLGVDGPDGALVATATSFPVRLAVPGGAVPAAGVTRVAVRADRTRRGLLTSVMRTQLEDLAARGEVLAALHATEASIYGRFGYGAASRSRRLRLTPRAPFRPAAPRTGEVRIVDGDTALAVLPGIHDAVALTRAGGLTRRPQWWGTVLGRRLAAGEPVLAAVHRDPDGRDDGFAVWSTRRDGVHETALVVEDLCAATAAATAGLWRFLLDIDLTSRVEAWLRPLDEPLELLLADPRACTTTAVDDELWVRILDVPAALRARSWGEAAPVSIRVHDAALPSNDGVHVLGGGTAAEPDLECDVAALAMAYLGDRRPSELVASGWWTAHDPAAVSRADVLFATAPPPWCGTMF
ncbi:MAG: GNAT family N-acetyltransferase [Pseudonocardia sp.]|nr:GNAT family N-acetyltransferase [Pseudonocardia sp.]